MDKLAAHRNLIKELLTERANLMRGQPVPGEEIACILDETTDNYLLIRFGWLKTDRLYTVTLHLRLENGLIHIEQDWTDDFLRDLIDMGVPRKAIVLGFDPPAVRGTTEFAAV